jgi:hypothetical protein
MVGGQAFVAGDVWRWRVIQASVRSTTQRRGSTWKVCRSSGRLTNLQRELRLELGRGPGDELSSVAAVGRAEITAADRDGAEGLAGIVPQVREPGAQAEVDFGDVTVKLGGQLSRCFLFAFRLSCSGKGPRSHIKPPIASPKAGRRCDRIMAGYPVQRRHPPVITREAARSRTRDSGTLSGTSAEEEQ